MAMLLEMRNISKSFPGVKALNGFSIDLKAGEVHALVGENGAGKSTLIKTLYGIHQPDGGEIVIDGVPTKINGPADALSKGIGVVFQELSVCPHLDIANNIFLGCIKNKRGIIDDRFAHEEAARLMEEAVGLRIPSDTPMKDLSIADQQMVEIMKAYSRENLKMIAFDEPTASLSDSEIDSLFRIIRKLKAEGKVIIYVSHRMAEIRQIADRVAIFKDGRFVGDSPMDAITDKELVKKMVGRDLGDIFSGLSRNTAIGDVVLEVRNLSSPFLKDASFQVRAGEVVGFSGLVGAGRTEVVRAIIGADPRTGGEVLLNGKPLNCRTPHDAIANGVVMVPEDRKLQGIIPRMSVGKNISIGSLDQITNRLGIVNTRREEQIGLDGNLEKPIVELSGGNQQKAIVARWMSTKPEVLILDEPTKGIDVGAKSEFYNMICEFAKEGLAVILISSELPEVIGLSDRIIVMRGRRIVGEISAKDATEEKLLSMAMMEET